MANQKKIRVPVTMKPDHRKPIIQPATGRIYQMGLHWYCNTTNVYRNQESGRDSH